MREKMNQINEHAVSMAFSKQAATFDACNGRNSIIQYKRQRVRELVQKRLSPNSRILELNAGTGEDSIYFASLGHRVHATDIAPGMLDQLGKKVRAQGLAGKVTCELNSFTRLGDLKAEGPYDLIFSNFAGLNCTGQLRQVLHSFKDLLRPKGEVILVLLPPFCLWETFLLFKGKFKTAFRRFFGANGAWSHIEGHHFKCWYYSPSFVIETLKDNFQVEKLEGLCTIVPPSYIEHFSERYPRAFRFLIKKENRYKDAWPWTVMGDYYIVVLRKKD
jgi:ubiquinone/menaquinone biosynthesis C-methylase UbiE